MSKEEKLKVFGCNLKRLRENASMTKSAVAAYLEIIPQQYYRYEDGTSEPGVILATKLASLYGVDVHDLFDGFNDIQERNLKIIRQLSDYGISAMASTDGEIFQVGSPLFLFSKACGKIKQIIWGVAYVRAIASHRTSI